MEEEELRMEGDVELEKGLLVVGVKLERVGKGKRWKRETRDFV